MFQHLSNRWSDLPAVPLPSIYIRSVVMSGSKIKNSYHVYVYCDPRKNNLRFYIGISGDERRRFKHLEEARRYLRLDKSQKWIKKNCTNPHKIRIIMKILVSGLEPKIVKVLENVNEEQAKIEEIRLISYYGRADKGLGSLTNLTDGGEGAKNSMGKKWYNNGTKDKYFFEGKQPSGWVLGRWSVGYNKGNKGLKIYNNGKIQKSYNPNNQPEGWTLGSLSKGNTGQKFYNNNIEDKCFVEGEQPKGWVKGSLCKNTKGLKYYNNGTVNKMYKPNGQPEGWCLGMFKTKN